MKRAWRALPERARLPALSAVGALAKLVAVVLELAACSPAQLDEPELGASDPAGVAARTLRRVGHLDGEAGG